MNMLSVSYEGKGDHGSTCTRATHGDNTVLGQKFPTARQLFIPPPALNYQPPSFYFDALKLRKMITYILATSLG